MRTVMRHVLGLALVFAGLAASSGSARAERIMLECHLDYSITSWSSDKSHGYGVGTIRCKRGENLVVKIRVTGDGLPGGDAKIPRARGDFKPAVHMADLVRTYTASSPGAGTASGTQVLGNLTLSGEPGWDLGIRFKSFELDRARTKSS